MKKIWIILITLFVFQAPYQLKAQDFFDTSDAESFFNLGARIGFNTSNRTFPKGEYRNMINTMWGTGFNAGVVANLNFKEYLSLQPGFFFESRSGNLINIVDYYKNNEMLPSSLTTHYAKLHQRSYNFTIPVMGIVKFNLAENIKWNVEVGPYVQILLKENGSEDDVNLFSLVPGPFLITEQVNYKANHNNFDFGFKLGTSLQLYDHYYIGVHYLAGVCNAWKLPSGGKNKSWMFSIGYDF